MTPEALEAELNEVFRDVFDDDGITIRDDMKADDIEEWDSLSHIRLIVEAENTFDVRFSQTEIEELENVGDFKRLIASKLS